MRFTFLTFVFIALLSACSNSIDEVNLVNIETEFEVKLSQSLSAEGSTPALKIRTIYDVDCSNSDIYIEESRLSNRTIFTIMGIEMETACNNISAPVSTNIPLPYFQDNLSIAINISTLSKNLGRISEEEDRFLLDMESYEGINVVGTSVLKIKKPMIWGYYHQNCQDQYDALKEALQKEELSNSISNGYYGLFRISNGKTIHLEQAPPSEHIAFFLPTEMSIGEIANIINNLQVEFGKAFQIQLTNHLGQEYY